MFDSIGEPLDEFNTWEVEWAKEKEERQRQARNVSSRRKQRVHSGPLKATGRRKAWKRGEGSRKRNSGGKFCSKGDQEMRATSST
jgi:hypothetical protein